MTVRSYTVNLLAGGLLLVLSGCVGSDGVNRAEAPVPKGPPLAKTTSAKQNEPGPADPDAPEEFTTTPSGLKYRILRNSTKRKPRGSNKVTVHYKGWLDDGKEFDSSYKRGEPTSFGLDQVVKGWTEGLQLIGTGGMIELEIPYQLAYGEMGRPGSIPPKATLHFIVELLEVQ